MRREKACFRDWQETKVLIPKAHREVAPIPFNRPSVVGREYEYIRQAIEKAHLSGNGAFTQLCEQLLQERTGAQRALLTTSCTDALEMAALLLRIDKNAEVIVPSFTFVSTANAFALRGAKLVFADIRRDTLNLDESALPNLITPRTRAIVVVHYAGVACEMDAILETAARHDIPVVEDNAQGLFGAYRGRPLGSLGKLAALSFHETKNVSCGEGGALLINDASLIERAEIVHEKGTDRSKFFRGEVDKYTWVDLGSSFLPSELSAAFLWAQLEEAERIQAARCAIWHRYLAGLSDWATSNSVRLPYVPPYCDQPYHMFYLLLPSGAVRDRMIEHFRSHRIVSPFHYLPLHRSKVGVSFADILAHCPIADDISDRLLRLPFYNSLSTIDQERVIETALQFKP
jgi:dTDP-4-amino-4,6-dideoxygalactose transaminase